MVTSGLHWDRHVAPPIKREQVVKCRPVFHAFKSKSASSRRTQLAKKEAIEKTSKTARPGKENTHLRKRETLNKIWILSDYGVLAFLLY